MLRWARNQAFRSRHIRFGSMRALCAAVSKQFAPKGVKTVHFHEPKDGKQHVVLYTRSILEVLKKQLADPRFAGVQYTCFRHLRTQDGGVRVFGAFNNGQWYEFAHATAQTLGGGQPVSVAPYWMGSDVTVGRKSCSMYPYFVASGSTDDDVRSEPSCWSIVAVFPHYKIKAARRAGRPAEGPYGYRRRKVPILHHTPLSGLQTYYVYTVWAQITHFVHTMHTSQA